MGDRAFIHKQTTNQGKKGAKTMLSDYEVVMKFVEDCRSIMAGVTITETIPRCSSAPYGGEVGTVASDFCGGVYEVLSITKLPPAN